MDKNKLFWPTYMKVIGDDKFNYNLFVELINNEQKKKRGVHYFIVL